MDPIRLFYQTFERGGFAIMVPIFMVSVVAWYIGVNRLLFLWRFQAARRTYLYLRDQLLGPTGTSAPLQRPATGIEEYDDLLLQLQRCNRNCYANSNTVYGLFREFLISAVPQLNRGYATMASWISVAPLLGLLGTVTGMIKTFRVITEFGVGNPTLTAEGISIALITTQAGLTVAFPAMLFHNYVANKKNGLVSTLLKDGEDLVNRTTEAAKQDPGPAPSERNGEERHV